MAQTTDTMTFIADYLDEKTALKLFYADMLADREFLLGEKVKVRPLKKTQVKTAASTLDRAAVDDPLFAYLRDAPDVRYPKRYRSSMKLQFAISTRYWVRRRTAFTVDKGHSVVYAGPAKAVDKPSKVDRYIGTLVNTIVNLLSRATTSKEQRKRSKEMKTKLEALVKDILGDMEKEMRSISSLATDPDFQRRGYGGALVDYVTSLADAEGRATYLLSSNPINTEFYNSHGFVEIGKVMIGQGNPTWKKPAMPILLMVRPLEPKVLL